MPTYRLVWQFVENTGAQFNEVYYRDAASIATALDTTGSLLGTNRLALMHPLNLFVGIRASQVGQARVTGFSSWNYYGTAPISGVDFPGPAVAGASMVFTLTGQAGGQRKLWMRGCPAYFLDKNPTTGLDFLPLDVADRINAWLQSLQAAGYGIRVLTGQTGNVLNNIAVTQVDGSAGKGISTLTLSQAITYPIPGRVILGRFSKKDLPALNGRWQVIDQPTQTTIRIPYQTPLAQIIPSTTGVCRSEQYPATSVFAAANSSFSYNGTHSTKNPRSHSRGARRATRIRQSL